MHRAPNKNLSRFTLTLSGANHAHPPRTARLNDLLHLGDLLFHVVRGHQPFLTLKRKAMHGQAELETVDVVWIVADEQLVRHRVCLFDLIHQIKVAKVTLTDPGPLMNT